MPDSSDEMPWMTAWIGVQRNLLEQAARAAGGNDDAMRRLSGFGGDYLGIAADWLRSAATPADLESMQALFIDRYRQLFTPEMTRGLAGLVPSQGSAAATMRWQSAAQRIGELVTAIAGDAFRRLSAALQSNDVTLPPIASVRGLHELWIECGEAAYAAAASREEFADAQVELLAAWVELQGERRRARP